MKIRYLRMLMLGVLAGIGIGFVSAFMLMTVPGFFRVPGASVSVGLFAGAFGAVIGSLSGAGAAILAVLAGYVASRAQVGIAGTLVLIGVGGAVGSTPACVWLLLPLTSWSPLVVIVAAIAGIGIAGYAYRTRA